MTYQRDPNEPLTGKRTGMRKEDGSWGVFPAVLGVIFLLLVGLIAYNMYSGETGPNSANPSAANSTNSSTNAPGTTITPKTTPTPAPPAATPNATPPTTPPTQN